MAAAPPLSREALPLPLPAVRDWLRGARRADVADLEGVAPGEQGGSAGRTALRWRGADPEFSSVVNADDLSPGDTVVVPAVYGRADEFGWDPRSDRPVSDLGDLCANEMADSAPDAGTLRLIRLRLHDAFLESFGPPQPETESSRTLNGEVKRLRELLEQGEDVGEALGELLASLAARSPPDTLTGAVVGAMAKAKVRVTAYPAGVVLEARVRPGFCRRATDEDFSEEVGADAAEPSVVREGTLPPRRVRLEDHTAGVVRWAESFARALGLDEKLAAAVVRAARLHDLGKADYRFQYPLYGDVPGDALLAKSGRDFGRVQEEAVRRLSGLPRHFRHEFVSAALVRKHRERLLGDMPEPARRLVEYLVGTHHGRGRPFAPVVQENEPEEVSLSWEGQALSANSDHGLWRLGSGWVDTFWAVLRRHGVWGSAYLEAVLRLADGARSAEERGKANG